MTIEAMNRIGLGTVQLGMDYGATNRSGRPSLMQSSAIIRAAGEAGVQVIDTAAAYGLSEQVLGKVLPSRHRFRLITKTPPLDRSRISRIDAEAVRAAFRTSLERLRQSAVSGLLVHWVGDVLADGGERLWDTLAGLRDEGLTEKIGVSVYTAEEIDAVLSRFDIELVQLPLNVFDQRLVRSGHMQMLHERGIEVHARSGFLQGVLLSDPEHVPDHLYSLREPLTALREFARDRGLSAVQAALAFVLQQPVDCVIIGACRCTEFQEVLEATEAVPEETLDFTSFACEDEYLINPAKWAA